MKELRTIGRREWVRFPSWESTRMEAKIDTGAYTSSLHCKKMKLDREAMRVRFVIPDPKTGTIRDGVRVETAVRDVRFVRSSNGLTEERVVVKTKIEVGDRLYPIELTLTDRSAMRYPILLGRTFLSGRFLVDVSKSDILDQL
ncbi:MAG: ATP-dependent zinc protease [Bacteroidota bacterium]